MTTSTNAPDEPREPLPSARVLAIALESSTGPRNSEDPASPDDSGRGEPQGDLHGD